MRRYHILVMAVLATISCRSQGDTADYVPYCLEGIQDTILFNQAPFEWHVSPRHDYSQTYVTKLFMSQALYDPEMFGKFKMRDNGLQENFMNCEDVLSIIKGMDSVTPGLPKIVYLVGWQYNGHDSKYPAFFEGNESIRRSCDSDALESLRWLMKEAKSYNTDVSLHINMFDCYPDSPLFDEYVREDVLAKDSNGRLLTGDWGYKVCYAAEWEKGLAQKRLDSLCRLLPVCDAGTLHIDAFHNTVPTPYMNGDKVDIKLVSPISPGHGYTEEQDVEAQLNIIEYLDSKGIDVTIEGPGEGDYARTAFNGYIPMYWHYGNEKQQMSLTPSQATGVNVSGPLKCFGYNLNGEAFFRKTGPVPTALDKFKEEFCKSTLLAFYLNQFGRKAMIKGRDGSSIGLFDEGVCTLWKDGYLNVSKNGMPLAENGDIFIPAAWLDDCIVAFSEKGCDARTWTVPDGIRLSRKVKAWTVTPDGYSEFLDFKVSGKKVTISLEPGQMVIFGNHLLCHD